MSFSENTQRRMISPKSKGKGISRPNPRYLKTGTARKNLLDKKLSGKNILEKKFSSQFSINLSDNDDAESISSKASTFINNFVRLGSNMVRGSRRIFNGNRSRSEGTEFFFANCKNKWRAEKSAVFTCNSETDNSPTHVEWRGFHFSISQNTLEGKKAMGQDTIGVASHKNWEVFVLCDGHDQDGHKVSQGVCATLPHFILRKINERRTEFSNRPVSNDLITEAFEETEEIVCWNNAEEVEQGDYVKIISGELSGETGYVANILDEEEEDEDDKKKHKFDPELRMTIVVENEVIGYHRIEKAESELRTPRYKGGSTCLCLIRNFETNKCKLAILGDSRMMIVGDIGSKYRDEDYVDDALMTTYIQDDEKSEDEPKDQEESLQKNCDTTDSVGFFTPQHNVYNAGERERLKAYQRKMNGEFVVNYEDGYLVNPETRMQIQPTRGFGDVEMQSSGYSHVPQISSTFQLSPNTVLVGASDGIFDGDLWETDEEFLRYVTEKRKEKMDAFQLTNSIYLETTSRCKNPTDLDDISLFVFISPETKKKYNRKQKPRPMKGSNAAATLRVRQNQQLSRTMKSRRSTIQRVDRPGAHLFRKFFNSKKSSNPLHKL